MALVDRHANELTLLTMRGMPFDASAENLVGRIRSELGARFSTDRVMFGNPLTRPVHNDGVSGPDAAAPAKPHAPHTTCPNCHKQFPEHVKTCPGCKVALFRD